MARLRGGGEEQLHFAACGCVAGVWPHEGAHGAREGDEGFRLCGVKRGVTGGWLAGVSQKLRVVSTLQ